MASGGAGDGDGTVRVRREVFASALRRLDAQLAQARQNAEAISERSREYRELRGVLAELPEKAPWFLVGNGGMDSYVVSI